MARQVTCLVRLSMTVFGTDAPWAMRLPSLFCGILCIPAAFWLGRVVRDDTLGLVAAALVAVDPNMVDQSQQARMYTMLALVTMLALARAVQLLRSCRRAAAVDRLGRIAGGAVLDQFGAAALWLGLAVTFAWTIVHALRGRDADAQRQARRMTHGALVAAGWAGLLAARGIWRMWIFVRSDRGITTTTASDTFAAIGRGCEQLIGTGSYSWVVLLAALVGLVMLWRQSRSATLVLALTALATLAMIFAGRSVHHMIAVRYFTVLQPAVWLGLAALVVGARGYVGRVALGGGLVALLAVQAWQSTHVDHWVDVNTWRYARAASRFIGESRDGGDHVVCTPDVNFGWVARYYDLLGPDEDRRRQSSRWSGRNA